MNRSKIYSILSGMNQLKWTIAIKGIFAGLLVGVLAVFYRMLIDFGLETAVKIYDYLRSNPIMILPWLLIIVAVGLLFMLFVKIEPMASGSGIPQVEGLLLYGMKMKWYLILPIRFVAGFISSLFGVSLGREGPSIQIGASISQPLSKKCCKNKLEENYIITGGAAAGLSAAFSAPLSGIMFALEEVHRSFSPMILIAATTASLTANVISNFVFGLKPELSFIEIPLLPVQYYGWLIPIGICTGILGTLINKSLLSFQTLYKKIPVWSRAMIALLVALLFGLFLPDLLGGGLNLVEMTEKSQIAFSLLILYLVAKVFFTSISFGSGIPGGIFMPILSTGAMTGAIIGTLGTHLGLPSEYVPYFCICAMAGALSGSVKAPVTSILLIAEMSGTLVHTLPVAVCAFSSLLVSDLLKTAPIYESLLERIVGETKKETKHYKSGALLEIPVEIGSDIANKKIKEVHWPEGSLVVSIHRGQKEITPNGMTEILPGDYLVILSSEKQYQDMSIELEHMCRMH